ncbi:hypothetical protein CASFOL_025949 [Castilleja foliolosa]|uniref:Uncharacterized protein n=1 Tax=Castilleja foliolosa TaxID=1961234 RepID=A0ABD3CWC1_9LAMI
MAHSSAMTNIRFPHLAKNGVPNRKRLVVGESFKPFPLAAKKIELKKIGKCFGDDGAVASMAEDEEAKKFIAMFEERENKFLKDAGLIRFARIQFKGSKNWKFSFEVPMNWKFVLFMAVVLFLVCV